MRWVSECATALYLWVLCMYLCVRASFLLGVLITVFRVDVLISVSVLKTTRHSAQMLSIGEQKHHHRVTHHLKYQLPSSRFSPTALSNRHTLKWLRWTTHFAHFAHFNFYGHYNEALATLLYMLKYEVLPVISVNFDLNVFQMHTFIHKMHSSKHFLSYFQTNSHLIFIFTNIFQVLQRIFFLKSLFYEIHLFVMSLHTSGS